MLSPECVPFRSCFVLVSFLFRFHVFDFFLLRIVSCGSVSSSLVSFRTSCKNMRILYNIMQVYTYTSSWQCSVHCFRLAGKVNVLNAPAGDGRSTAQQRGGGGAAPPTMHRVICMPAGGRQCPEQQRRVWGALPPTMHKLHDTFML